MCHKSIGSCVLIFLNIKYTDKLTYDTCQKFIRIWVLKYHYPTNVFRPFGYFSLLKKENFQAAFTVLIKLLSCARKATKVGKKYA